MRFRRVLKRASVASWLYQVAFHVATRARKQATNRHRREERAAAPPERDSALVGLGVNALGHRNIHAYLDYDVDLGESGYHAYTATAGARIRF